MMHNLSKINRDDLLAAANTIFVGMFYAAASIWSCALTLALYNEFGQNTAKWALIFDTLFASAIITMASFACAKICIMILKAFAKICCEFANWYVIVPGILVLICKSTH